MSRALVFAAAGAAVLVTAAGPCFGSPGSLLAPNSWPSLASDRQARQVGDSLTVVVYENSTAQNTALAGSQRGGQLSGQATTSTVARSSAQLNLRGQYDSQASMERTGRLVAQISVTVDGILPNGDLHVSGQQMLNISGDRTKIGIRGRVRRQDISPANTVLSTRLADALIDYDGAGFVSRGAKPGIVGRVFNFLGLL